MDLLNLPPSMDNFGFLLKTAYRDSSKNLGKLFMFMSSIVLGVTALVAINSFNHNLVRDIQNESKKLLGADILVSGNRPLTPDLENVIDSLGGEKSKQLELFSMSYIPKSDETQFVRIRAVEGNFPFYGSLNTEPKSAALSYKDKKEALLDDGLMKEHELSVGDSIKLGERMFRISGRLLSTFGSVSIGSSFAPSVYIPYEGLESTQLVQPGSMVEYNYYRKLDEGVDGELWEESFGRKEKFRDQSFRVTTLDDNRRNLDRVFESLNSFLNLVALVSLLLGCIGVASSVLIYIRSKVPSIAVLRCIGMKENDAFLVFFSQIFILGFIGVLIGTFLGSMLQILLPIVLKDVLPYEVDLKVSWRAVMQGLFIGTTITSLFALVPLLSVRKISPLRTLRASFGDAGGGLDKLQYMVYAGILLMLLLFLFSLTESWMAALIFTVGILLSFGILYGMAALAMFIARRFFPRQWSFVLRQGISNLFRPNNQTKTLIVSIGLGTSILTTLFIIQGLLLNNVQSMDAGEQPNMILYGIKTDQKDTLAEITKEFDLPLVEQVPIVTMRLAGWKGRTKSEWLTDTINRPRRWAVNREARVTYRDTIAFDEKLIRGEYTGYVSAGDSIWISLDEGYAESLNVDIGDEMIWNVQGTELTTYVGSIREINFRSMRTRFFILFPRGVLEAAPQFHVLVSKAPNNDVLAAYRRKVVRTFPNVSVVDLGSILVTLNDILSKVSYIIKFMAGFSILTGLIVLLSSLLLSKYQRIKESVLLRTLGAVKEKILMINATEYAILGAISAFIGILISLISSYLIATQQMELDFQIQWWPIFGVFIFITLLTVIIGLWNTRDVISKSPLEVLRKEVN